ncbi:MAG: amidohydrolase [Deltaproteobacteria bacterium]|nr:amidohydrolase [Deltaproteobacteria bacterium]
MALAILSATVFTGDPARPRAEAVGIENGKIVAVGSNEDVMSTLRGKVEEFRRPGRLVIPGLVDGHCHFLSYGLYLQRVDLRDLPSLAACRERIREAVRCSHPGEWILGRGWNHHNWNEKREPCRQDLDDIAPANPVMMVRACGHSQWVNSQALSAVKITRDMPDPPGGQIDRDPRSGEPTGMLRELRYLVERVMPAPSLEARKQAVLLAQKDALRLGITGVHTCERFQQWEAFEALDRAGALKVRVYHLLPPDDLDEAAACGVRPAHGSERLWAGHVKLYADGSLGAGTALLHEPYTDELGNSGLVVLDLPLLQEKIDLAYRRGFHVAIHAIGDKAVTHCLLAISRARTSHPGVKRDRIEHVQLYRPEDLALFRELGVVGSVQPRFVSTDWCVAEKRWGAARCQTGYAWRSLMNAGIPLLFGSDAPVEPLAPILGLQAAVTRQTPEGKPPGGWFPGQRLTLEEGISGFTAAPAWVAGREEQSGSIRVGKWADLTVFAQDLFVVPPSEWPSVPVEMTIVNGEVLYRHG